MVDFQSLSVKCLNNSSGRRRFVFKRFSQRVHEINIDVFHSLDPVKVQPVHGSTFLHEALLHWRELNTAEGFISFYHEMLPLVQTLTLVLLHKEKIFFELQSRLRMEDKLSIEPVLMLIVAFSRDILNDFLPFLQSFVGSLVDLLKSGGDRDPEILEQVFTTWSYIIMHLQGVLVKKVVFLFKITAPLRFYPKDYVQDLMASALAFLLRNSPIPELEKGIMKVIREAGKYPSPDRKHGAIALLRNVMRGSSSMLHSKAEKVLSLLMGRSIFEVSSVYPQGLEAVYDVITGALLRLSEEINYTGLNMVYDFLFKEISCCINDDAVEHLSHLLDLLTFIVRQSNRNKMLYGEKFSEIVKLLIHAYIIPSIGSESEDSLSGVVIRILRLMVSLLDGWGDLTNISLLYAPSFKLRNKSLLSFIKGLVQKDPDIIKYFRIDILRSLVDMIEGSTDEVLYLMTMFFDTPEKLSSWGSQDGVPKDVLFRFCSFFEELLCSWERTIHDFLEEKDQNIKIDESKLSNLWGILCCYPHFQHNQSNISRLLNLIDELDVVLKTKMDIFGRNSMYIWEGLLGAALASFHQVVQVQKSLDVDISKFLNLARRYKQSPKVLVAVAGLLDCVVWSTKNSDVGRHGLQELDAPRTLNAISTFADSLSLPSKIVRISTLKILSHFAPLGQERPTDDERPLKKLKTEDNGSYDKDTECDVIKLLLVVEMTPVSVSTSRQIMVQISRLQTHLTSSRIDNEYIPLLFHAIIGILHNRFDDLWEPTMEFLSILIQNHKEIVWNKFVQILGNYQSGFLTHVDQFVKLNPQHTKPKCLGDKFTAFLAPDADTMSCMTAMSLLLKTLQKLPDFAESNSRDLVPLFLNFWGYIDTEMSGNEPFNAHNFKQKEWKMILKEWLNTLKSMRNARSLYRSQYLKEVLINRLLDEIDPDIQLIALDCLLNWRDNFLIPYEQHLRNLIISKNHREELTTWAVSRESHNIQDDHREHLIPIVVRLLTPKVRKMKALGSRKYTGVNPRRAVLSFLAQLDVDELHLFFSLLLGSLFDDAHGRQLFVKELTPTGKFFGGNDLSVIVNFLAEFPLGSLSWKKRYSFLHVLEDILRVFDELRLRPFLDTLMCIVVCMLESCMLNLSGASGCEPCITGGDTSDDMTILDSDATKPVVENTPSSQYKVLRSLCLKIISFALNKYDSHDFGSYFWDVFFHSVKPLVDDFKHGGSSSEKPSALFSCFVSMSRSPVLVLLLNREANLVPTIFSILTVRTASDAIVSSVLCFIENLLDLDDHMNTNEDDSVKSVLLPHVDVLISSLHGHFHTKKSSLLPGRKELRIFGKLAKYIKDPLVAEQFLDMMLPFFKIKAISSNDCMEGLHLIELMVPFLSDKTMGKVLKSTHRLLFNVNLDLRLSICNILHGMSLKDPGLVFLAGILKKLNAVSSLEIDELDYDTRLEAYDFINSNLFSSLKEEHVLVLLSHCVYDMSSEELILRQNASKSLLSFVHFATAIINKDSVVSKDELPCDEKQGEKTEMVIETSDESSWTKPCIQRIITKIFLHNIAESMGKDMSIQKEWIAVLRDMVRHLEGFPNLAAFRALYSDDDEIDFFNNIVHLQIHRRVRALARFRSAVKCSGMPKDVLLKVFVPLFFNMLFDEKNGKEHLKNACIETLAAILKEMEWEPYRTFLMRCFKEITLMPQKQKVLLRLLCAILDSFHFSSKHSSCPLESGDSKTSDSIKHGEILDGGIPTLYSEPTIPQGIEDSLQRVVFPQLQKLLTQDAEKINVNISLAALKLLKLLPIETMESQLPSVIHRISNFLKSRLESLRDEARHALAACLKELGPAYLHFIVTVLQATLKRGYELHVLGYTLNFLISKAFTDPITGQLDYCLEEILSIAENDILGDVAEEKEVGKIASKMKETRKNKSFETLKLIAQRVTFRSHALMLLSHVSAHFQKHVTAKAKAKLGMMLQYIALGLRENPSVEVKELLVFVFGFLEDNITQDNRRDLEKSGFRADGIDATASSREMSSERSYFILVFSLGLMLNFLKNMKLEKNDAPLLEMLDPFVDLLGKCLNSKYEDVLLCTVRCLATLARLPLPSLDAQAEKIKYLILEFSYKSGNHSPLMQSSLKLLTALLRSTKISLSHHELRLILQLPLFLDIQANPSPVGLGLLKLIISKKMVVHEIYDLVLRVAELMVTSQSDPIRKKCSQILLQFLLKYPLSEKRLQQHMDFLLKNLSYEHPSGRESILEMLHAILVKSGRSFLETQAQTIFIHLVVSLSNEWDNKVRLMVATVLKELFGRTNQSSLRSFLEYSLSWYTGDNQSLWSAAAHVLGLLVQVFKKGFQRYINSIFQVTKRILETSADISRNKESNVNNAPVVLTWKEAYYSLTMLDQILLNFPKIYANDDLEKIWEMICILLLHPHASLRDSSSRLVALYFASVSDTCRVDHNVLNSETFYLVNPCRLFLIAVSSLKQLRLSFVDETASEVAAKNLVYAICGLHSFSQQNNHVSFRQYWSTIDLVEKGTYSRTFELLGSRKARNSFAHATGRVEDCVGDQAEHDHNSFQSMIVVPLLKNLDRIAMQMEDAHMKIVFNSLMTIATQIGRDGCCDYAVVILLPFYRACEGYSGKNIAGDVKQLATEARDSVRDVMGVEDFVRGYNEIRKMLKHRRDKRRQRLKIGAALNTPRHAQRKRRLAVKHQAYKKRKMDAIKQKRRR